MNSVNIKMDKNLQWKLYQMGIKDIKKKGKIPRDSLVSSEVEAKPASQHQQPPHLFHRPVWSTKLSAGCQ